MPTTRTKRESPFHAYDPFLVLSPNQGQGDDPNDDDAFLWDRYKNLTIDNNDLAECLLDYPVFDEQGRSPITKYKAVEDGAEGQLAKPACEARRRSLSDQYKTKTQQQQNIQQQFERRLFP